MKLQKLVYFTHGWWLAINSISLLNERPQVGSNGPVFSSLYNILKNFGHQPIMRPQLRYPTEDPLDMVRGNNIVPSYIDFVWERYGHLSGFALSGMTHQPESAWAKIASEYGYQVPLGLEIPDEYIKDEFLKTLNEEYARNGEAPSS